MGRERRKGTEGNLSNTDKTEPFEVGYNHTEHSVLTPQDAGSAGGFPSLTRKDTTRPSQLISYEVHPQADHFLGVCYERTESYTSD